MPGGRWIRAHSRLGVRVEAQETGPNTLRLRGRLQARGPRRQPQGRLGPDPLVRHRARPAYSVLSISWLWTAGL
eukprot:2062548-Pyramimonas_sp.AAC.1